MESSSIPVLKELLPKDYHPEILAGPDSYRQIAALSEVDIVIGAIVGAAGLESAYAAAKAGKILALANKEALVLAGELIREEAARSGAVILPVDSEHNAILQCLGAGEAKYAQKIILTASGGPFRDKDRQFLENVTPEEALAHPNWSMGAKISVDSATLMNKGLEVIEAWHLFGLKGEQVEVLIHPQSIIHSLVEFGDGSILAHLGPPDMRLAIAYCLFYPERLELGLQGISLAKLGQLTFATPRWNDFPCLGLALKALEQGQGYPVVMNAANEVAVEAFLERKLKFTQIPELIALSMDKYSSVPLDDLQSILELDRRTRIEARSYLEQAKIIYK